MIAPLKAGPGKSFSGSFSYILGWLSGKGGQRNGSNGNVSENLEKAAIYRKNQHKGNDHHPQTA